MGVDRTGRLRGRQSGSVPHAAGVHWRGLIVAGIAAFIEAHSHQPETALREGGGERIVHVGLSKTAYDLLRIGAWALVIFGALRVVVGLVAYVRDGRERAGA